MQVTAARIFMLFFFFLHVFISLPSSRRDLSLGTTFEVYMEQSSGDQEGMICEHFLFSEHIICQCFLVVLR